MEREIFVYVDLDAKPHLAGRLWTRVRKGRESASFEYARSWLAHGQRFALEPALTLGPGPFHTPSDKPLFGAVGDSAPDRWGRALMRRAERRRADKATETPRTLHESDYLLMVDDEARQGALRFARQEGGAFLNDQAPRRIPPLVDLARLRSAAERAASENDTEEDLRLLLAPGSSLGGARPKASVRDRDGHLAIAKFSKPGDEINAVLWEALCLSLAERAGLAVPDWRLESAGGKPALLLRRFDREDGARIPFLSAMSMLAAKDNEERSYLEIAEALRRHGARPTEDMRGLWQRIVFSILISNTDDHLRNHGFLYDGQRGWRLSPAYDLNPVPVDIRPRVLSTSITEDDATASLDLAYEVAGYFGVEGKEAREIAARTAKATGVWRREAKALGLNEAEIERMGSAFEHEDAQALRGSGRARR